MKHLIKGGAIAAGLLVSLVLSNPLSAQTTPQTTARMPQDTSCMDQARPLGDSTKAAYSTTGMDSTGINKSRHCMDPNRTAKADSLCQMSDSAWRADSVAGRSAKAARQPCPTSMGAGVGNDTTKWQTRPDSAGINKPKKP